MRLVVVVATSVHTKIPAYSSLSLNLWVSNLLDSLDQRRRRFRNRSLGRNVTQAHPGSNCNLPIVRNGL